MAVSILSFIGQLEREIVDFYSRLKNLAGYLRATDTIESMIRESREHAARVEILANRYEKPEIKQHVVREVHEKIMSALLTEIGSSRNIRGGMEKIAHTEEQVGKLYQFIADYYERLSVYYKTMAEEITKIAVEEFNHRDRVLDEMKKF